MTDYLSTCEAAARAAGIVLCDLLGTIHVNHKKNAFDLVTEADIAAQKTIETILFDAFPDHRFLGEEGNLTKASSTRHAERSEYCWIVDPLDGTTNYVHGVPLFCTSIALVKDEQPICAAVFNPLSGEFFSAETGRGTFLNGKRVETAAWSTLGESLVSVSFPTETKDDSPDLLTFLKALKRCQAIRRTGSTALNLCFVASGRFDASWAFQCHPWDIAAGLLLVQEAGGVVTRPDGRPIRIFDDPSPICAVANSALQREVMQLFGE